MILLEVSLYSQRDVLLKKEKKTLKSMSLEGIKEVGLSFWENNSAALVCRKY